MSNGVAAITAKELSERWEKGEALDIIDVRTPAEFREVHLAMARNEPLERLDAAALLASHDPSRPLYVVCQSGGRGQIACERLLRAGMAQVLNVEGGTRAAQQTSLPLVRGKKTISLERQVRIAAGSLVLLGVLLAYFVHPYFVGLSAFVGAGLVFAGVTDTCGMGMLLARMPWNQVRVPPSESCARS